MTTRSTFIEAPDFELTDLTGTPVRLSDYYGRRHVVLALLRGLF